MKNSLTILIIAIGTVIGVFTSSFILSPYVSKKTELTPVPLNQKQIIKDVPNLLVIPTLSLGVSIEPVGKDREGRIDIPKNVKNVGWYSVGIKPGEVGNAVVSGHYKLSTLEIGDAIALTTTAGKTLKFMVVNKATYDYKDFPEEQVFGATDKKMLNLLGYEGIYDDNSKIVVVYTELLN